MGELSPTHWLIVILVAVVLFGARRLPDAARSLGRSARILKSEISGIHDDAKPAADTPSEDAAPGAAPAGGAPIAEPAALESAPTGPDQPSTAPASQPEPATPDTARP